MKEIARISLKPGMVIGADIFNYQNKLVVTEGTQVNPNIINKLARHSIVSVPIKEELARALTYSEKIRSSKGFTSFQRVYRLVLPIYRKITEDLVSGKIPFSGDQLMDIYGRIYESLPSHESLLDYLYNMEFRESEKMYTHGINCALVAGLFGSWLSFSKEKTRLLALGGFLHDIGIFKLPEALVSNTGTLSELANEKLKTHTFTGFELLQKLNGEDSVLKAALMHHERYDGTGYPSRLHDKQIDIYARCMAVVDAYEAMLSAPSSQQAGNPFQAITHFEKDASGYDPELLHSILCGLANHMVGFPVLLSNGQVGEVLAISPKELTRPLVRTGDGSFIDLASHKNLTIQGFY